MQSYNEDVLVDQRARGTITILDYTLMAGKTVTVNANVLTEGSSFNRGASNNACATALAAAINALSNVDATASGNVVTIVANASGTTPNAYNLLTNGAAGALTLSGATLSGGVNEQFTEWRDCVSALGLGLQMTSYLKELSGSDTPRVEATVQYSTDKLIGTDYPGEQPLAPFTALNAPQGYFNYYKGMFFRHKLVAAGTNTRAVIALNALKT